MPNKIIAPLIFFLLPLLFLPLTPNMFATPKIVLLVVGVLALALTSAYQLFATRTLTTSSSPLRFALGGFGLAIILNLLVNPEARSEALVGPASTYLLLCAWSYFLTFHRTSTLRKNLLYSFLGATSLLALHTVLQLTLLSRLSLLPLYMQTRSFTPTGSPLTTFLLLIFGLALTLVLTLKVEASDRALPKPLLIFLASLHTISLIALGFLMLPGGELAPLLLPLTASWSIALDALKSLHSFFFGVGLASYGDFAASVKPLFLNSTVFWNQPITTSGSELLEILTTMGVLGLGTFLALPYFALRSEIGDTPFKTLFVLSGLALVLTPGSLPVLLVFMTALGVLCARPVLTRPLTFPVALSGAVAIVGVVALVGFYTVQFTLAEWHVHNAQEALIQSDGKAVYDENLAAVKLIPTLASYHLSYSQVNLSLASALSQKSPLGDTDRQNITQLVAQAVSEGKTATALRPHASATWQNLGSLYRNLVNVAGGADQFATSAYAQAVALDPGSPALRVEFGGLLYQLGVAAKNPSDQAALFTRAESELQTAISLKPDYANAYYNLSKLLESTKDYSNSYLALQKAISLLGPDSQDLGRATSELENLKTKLPRSEAKTPSGAQQSEVGQSQLNPPSPLPSPISGGTIPLPSATP